MDVGQPLFSSVEEYGLHQLVKKFIDGCSRYRVVQHGRQGEGSSGCFLEHEGIEFVFRSGHAEPQLARVGFVGEGLAIYHQGVVVSVGSGVGSITGLGNVDGQFVGFAVLEGGIYGFPDAM